MTYPPPAKRPMLVRACLDHLCREQAILVHIRDSLLELQSTLCRGDSKSFSSAVERYSAVAGQFDQFAQAREAFRNHVAMEMGLPPGRVTISRIVERLPDAVEVREAQQRLQELTREVREFLQHTFAIVHGCQTFTRRLLAEICGAEAPSIAMARTEHGRTIERL